MYIIIVKLQWTNCYKMELEMQIINKSKRMITYRVETEISSQRTRVLGPVLMKRGGGVRVSWRVYVCGEWVSDKALIHEAIMNRF